MNLLEHVNRYWPYRWVPEIFSETAPMSQVEYQHVFVELIKQNRQRGFEDSSMAFMMEQNLITQLMTQYGFSPYCFIYEISTN